ncbi:MAG: NADAR family protein [Methanobrevibacter thaueri]|nr:NADAR family protein [Methanobrevibacter thaueri]
MKLVGFHNPDEENGYLSNWHLSRFEVDGIEYSSMEQYMMHQKAIYFKDDAIADEIMDTDDPRVIKELGRKVSNFNSSYWNGIRQIVVYRGLYAKFSQNDELAEKLKSTGDAVLAECSYGDRIWAIGISMDDDDRFDISKWKGQNLLGYALMMVREQL